MDGAELGSTSVGSVKATVNFFDDKVCSARTGAILSSILQFVNL